MPKRTAAKLTGLRQQLEQALDHYNDSVWLGEHSSLATPYVLGVYLHQRRLADQPHGRGEALQQLLAEAIDLLASQPETQVAGAILHQRYREEKPVKVLEQELGYSHAQLWRNTAHAIQRLERLVIQKINPPLRTERPIALTNLIERSTLQEQIAHALASKTLVGISGPAGMGKTALAATIAARYRDQSTFFLTIRQGINDTWPDFLFALGHFLRSQCRPSTSDLWLQVISDQDIRRTIHPQAYIELVRHSVTTCIPPPLICIDDVDVLHPENDASHAALCGLLQSLEGYVPMIVVGQRLPLICNATFALNGLSSIGTIELLEQQGISNASSRAQTITPWTHGNPRLVQMCAALLHLGIADTELRTVLTESVAVNALLIRIWARLSLDLKNALSQLAVFRRAVIPSLLQAPDATIKQLSRLHLLNIDGESAVSVPEIYREGIVGLVDPEELALRHQSAALARAQMAEYTEAAYHFMHGGQLSLALKLWYEHRNDEISRGQGHVAFQIFSPLRESQFATADRRLFRLVRGELLRLVGQYGRAEADIDAIATEPNDEIAREALIQKADLSYLRNNLTAAKQALVRALELSQKYRDLRLDDVRLRTRLGHVFIDEIDFESANHQAQQAQMEVFYLFGLLAEHRRNFAEAQRFYSEALEIARTLHLTEGEAKIRASLGVVLAYIGTYDQAEQQHHQALALYKQIGRTSQITFKQAEWVMVANLVGKPAVAINVGLEILPKAEAMGNTRLVASIAHNLAESYLAIRDVAQAERYAAKAIQQEETQVMPDSLRLLAEIYLVQGHIDTAEQYALQSVKGAIENGDPFIEGYARRTLGRIYQANGKLNQAKDALAQAITRFQTCGAMEEVTSTEKLLPSD